MRGYVDDLGFDLRMLDASLPADTYREAHRINDRAERYAEQPDFSEGICDGLEKLKLFFGGRLRVYLLVTAQAAVSTGLFTSGAPSMRAFVLSAALLLFPATLLAQAGSPGWSVGAGIVVSESAYRGSDSRIFPIPAIRYESDTVYLLGLEAGMHLQSSARWRTDLFLSARLDGADDIRLPGSSDLERDDSADVGLRLTYLSGATSVAATVKRDALGVSDGSELGLKISRVYQVGRTFITPGIGVRFLDSRLANYYYGTFANEVAAGIPAFRPGSATVAEASVTALLPTRTHWVMFAQLSASRLPGAISDSPLVDKGTIGSIIAGASYQF